MRPPETLKGEPTSDQARRDPFRSLLALSRRGGDVARYRAGAEAAFLINDPDHVKHILVDNHANYTKTTVINSLFKEAVADGLLTSEGEDWWRQRRLMQPAFYRERVAGIGDGVIEATLAMMERWEPHARSGEPLDVAVEMGSLTLRITTRALFSVDISEHADSLGHQIAEGLGHMIAPSHPEFVRSRARVEDTVTTIIERRRHDLRASTDLLALLLAARDQDTGEGMTDREVRDQVITLMLAGYETTANALCWTWYLLSQNPRPMRVLRDEVRSVLGGRTPTVADLQRLPYNRMVLDESMRLYPPAWILGRRAVAEDKLGEHVIPAGSVVAMSPYAMHRNPDLWDEPEEFRPERFTREQSVARTPFAYFPFGGGPRLCIGHNFALLEAQLITATVAQTYALELVPGRRVVPERRFVLRPRDGLLMMVRTA
jgi:cytochrome P450